MAMMVREVLFVALAGFVLAVDGARAQQDIPPDLDLPDSDLGEDLPPGATGPDDPANTILEPESADDYRAMLDNLFARLQAAPDDGSADVTEQLIWNLWLYSGSDTVDFLMRRTLGAIKAQNYPLALDLLNAVVTLKPDYAEGWNKRATVFFLLRDYARSLHDVERTLALEPRHFGALAGLGMIMRDVGDDEKALAAFRRALQVHPHLKAAEAAVRALQETVEGRDI